MYNCKEMGLDHADVAQRLQKVKVWPGQYLQNLQSSETPSWLALIQEVVCAPKSSGSLVPAPTRVSSSLSNFLINVTHGVARVPRGVM